MDEALARLDARGVRFGVALIRRSRVLASPRDPGAADAAELAAAFFRSVGALTMLPALEPFVGSGTTGVLVAREAASGSAVRGSTRA